MNLHLIITPPQEIRESISKVFDFLKRKHPYFTWYETHTYSIEVVRLGDRDEVKMPLIIQAVEQSLYDVTPISLFGLHASLFQNDGIIIRVEFVRNKELEIVRERLIDVCSTKNIQFPKGEYIPSIMVGSHKLPSKQQYFHLKKLLSEIDIDLEFTSQELHLVDVKTKSTNSEYEIIHTFELVD